MEVYLSLMQPSRVLVSEHISSTWLFGNPSLLNLKAVPIPRASSSSVSIQQKKRECVKEMYLLLKSVTLKLVHVFVHIY